MKKVSRHLILSVIVSPLLFINTTRADEKILSSEIISVKLYQNQAKITRRVKAGLVKGTNAIIIGNLPRLLYDWSIKGSLSKKFRGKIVSLEVEKKALVRKRQKRILKIEAKLERLRDKDQVLVDDLKNIRTQEKFLNSILEFTNQTVSKELATRIPQVKVWDNTLNYVASKKKLLLKQKRQIEKERETIGKNIQKWEFELSQIAGYNYFRNYQTLNKLALENRAAMNVQQFANISEKYAERKKLLKRPDGKIDIEKRLIVSIYSDKTTDVYFTFSYVIPNTYWQMQYDIRASNEKKKIDMVIYANIYQKTEEDWKNINMYLSTGAPINAIRPPVLNPWFLDVYQDYETASYDMKSRAKRKKYQKGFAKAEEDKIQTLEPSIREKGPYFEIKLPLKQTIISSNKYQKKYIKDYKLKESGKVKFYYELTPLKVSNSFLRVVTENTTSLPWLSGEAQIFLENEFMGKIKIPIIPPGKSEDFILGIEPRLSSKKELVKKYEDTSGLFGGDRRILYKYKIIIENQLPRKTEVIVQDVIPVSRNKKIHVEIAKISHPFIKDEKFEKTTEYAQGIRKWKLNINSRQKVDITYDLVISFDKDIKIKGIR